jgi:ABC-type xylose transport system substrate-binding protein
MRTTPRTAVTLAGVAAALVAVLAGCGSSSSPSTATKAGPAPVNTKVGILLPDTASSPRWVSADPTELKKQCTVYKLTCSIDNANGSATTQQSQAQALINAGVGVLLLVNLDSGSGKAIEALAQQHNVVTIDHDRLTAGGSASYYVSYDNVKVGEDQGTALTQCPQVKGKSAVDYVDIDGAPTDNNATLFAQGYSSVLSKQPGWKKFAEQTGNWDAATAQTVFTTMLGQHPAINAVMVANDTMAQSVINVLNAVARRTRTASRVAQRQRAAHPALSAHPSVRTRDRRRALPFGPHRQVTHAPSLRQARDTSARRDRRASPRPGPACTVGRPAMRSGVLGPPTRAARTSKAPAASDGGPRVSEDQTGRTDSACGPRWPWVMSNSTRWFSSSDL